MYIYKLIVSLLYEGDDEVVLVSSKKYNSTELQGAVSDAKAISVEKYGSLNYLFFHKVLEDMYGLRMVESEAEAYVSSNIGGK